MATLRSAVGAPPPFRSLTVDGVALAFNDEGTGPAVVCLHAIGHGAGDFTRLRAHLRDRYRVLAVDWPGQGSSAPDHRRASAGRYTQLLEGLLAAAGVERAVLVGNSIGGAVAIRYAAAHPERVHGLVLANPGGLDRGGDLVARLALGGMVRFFDAGARGAWWYPRAFAAYYGMVLSGAPAAEQRRRVVASAREIAPLLAQAWRSFGEPDADVRPLAPRITCPVLFTWAEGDRTNQLARCRAGIAAFPNATLETFPGGHAAFLEAPDAFEASLDRFLGRLAVERPTMPSEERAAR
jgi:4,5:9,10-diseco-3-hydroxy-5,9,17-trioxoandrosta-1(10),2-diene-4-oate hydrolase